MRFIGFDIETRGVLPEYALQAYRAGRGLAQISAASLATTARAVGLHNPTIAQLETLLTPYQGRYVVAWNTCFDVSWLYAVGVNPALIEGIKWLDGMLLWMHWIREPEPEGGPRKSYSLEAAMKEFFPEAAGFKEFKEFQGDTQEALAGLLHRNKEDARFTAILAETFWEKLSEEQRQAVLIEARCIPLVAQTYNRGITIDKEAALRLQGRLKKDGETAYAALKAHYPEIDSVNLGSPAQLGTLLYDTWGLPCTKRTKGTVKNLQGNRSTDKFALHDLAETYPQARLLRDYRESQYNTAKYAEATLTSLEYNEDGVTRPQAKIFGTYTSRMTYYSKQGKGANERPTGIALHQWKRGADFRDLISVPEEFDLIELDFAGQEFGLMAVASGDTQMLALREPGEDAHSFMGAQIAQIDYRELIQRVHDGAAGASQQRKMGKFANLSFQYRIGAAAATTKARVEYELDLTQPFVQGILDTYKRTYPGIKDYWTDSINLCRRLGYAETFAGRRINLNGDWLDRRQSWALESTAINYPIQGTGGDQKYLALAVARNMLAALGGYFYFELHDGLFFILPKGRSREGALKLRQALSNLPYKAAWGVQFPITFPVDCKIGPSWGQLKEVQE